jgi:hypothetical protein
MGWRRCQPIGAAAMPDDTPPLGEIMLYQTDDGRTRVECRFLDDTLWLSQVLMAELFQKDVRTINEHIQNIYAEGELTSEATIRKFRITAATGMTTPELIVGRADHVKPNMGLTTWQGSVVRKADVVVARGRYMNQELLAMIEAAPAAPDRRGEVVYTGGGWRVS